MMSETCDDIYKASQGLTWVVEDCGVRLIDEFARNSQMLYYPEAAIWELLLGGHSIGETMSMTVHIFDMPQDIAVQFVKKCVDMWYRKGWLEKT